MDKPTLWAVDHWLPDYPVEVESVEQLEGMAGEQSQIVLYGNKRAALLDALRLIRGRIRTMHDEGMQDRDYDNSRDWADALVKAIDYELRTGEEPDFQEMANDIKTFNRESGRW